MGAVASDVSGIFLEDTSNLSHDIKDALGRSIRKCPKKPKDSTLWPQLR